MPIPDYQTLMLPVLRLTEDGNEYSVTEIRQQIANAFHLTPEELSQKLKSGSTLFANRVAWAISYLNKAQLLTLTTRGVYRITDRGTTFLKGNPPAITAKNLRVPGVHRISQPGRFRRHRDAAIDRFRRQR
jgi:restriction system protein